MSIPDLNEVVISGRLTKDPELTYIDLRGDDVAVTEVTVAVNRGGEGDKADFLRVKVWRGQAENLVRYCSKGREVFVVGRLRQDSWEEEDGDGVTKKRSRTLVEARFVKFGAVPKGTEEDEIPI